MINVLKAIKTVYTIGKTISDVKKDIEKSKNDLQNKIAPLETYVNNPNQNNIDIAKMKDDIILLKNAMKQIKAKKKTDDVKWYDD